MHPILFFRLFALLYRLVASGRHALPLRQRLLPTRSEIRAEAIPRIREIDRHPARVRHILVRMAWKLVEDWPTRFVEACDEVGLHRWLLVKEPGDVPFVYADAVSRHLVRQMHHVGVGEIDTVSRHLAAAGQAPTYEALKSVLGVKFHAARRLSAPVGATVSILSKTNVRMVIIDEIHNSLTGPHDKRVHFLNTIKYMSNELCVPIVAIGTSLALSAIQTDQQLGSRLEPFKLPKWEADKEFAQFLGRVFMHLKVNPVPAVNSRKFRERFIHMTDGLTGEVWSLAVKTAEAMHAKGQDVATQ